MIAEVICSIAFKSFIYGLCLLGFTWLLKELTMGICSHEESLTGKVILITGGHEGVGLETVVEIAKRGAKIIIGGPKISNVKEIVLTRVPDADVEVMWLDLSSNDRIRHFAKEILARFPKIDVLINNASSITNKSSTLGDGRRSGALSRKGRTKTADGFELIMGENYFGHFLLNHLLLAAVKAAGESSTVTLEQIDEDSEHKDHRDTHLTNLKETNVSRIIVVSSPIALTPWANQIQKNGKIFFDDDSNNPVVQFSKSKLAQLMYVSQLSKILKQGKCNTIVTGVYPGLIPDKCLMQHCLPQKYLTSFEIFKLIFGKTLLQEAQSAIYLSQAKFLKNDDLINGQVFLDCRPVDFLKPSLAKDIAACESLWNKTEEVLGIKAQ